MQHKRSSMPLLRIILKQFLQKRFQTLPFACWILKNLHRRLMLTVFRSLLTTPSPLLSTANRLISERILSHTPQQSIWTAMQQVSAALLSTAAILTGQKAINIPGLQSLTIHITALPTPSGSARAHISPKQSPNSCVTSAQSPPLRTHFTLTSG